MEVMQAMEVTKVMNGQNESFVIPTKVGISADEGMDASTELQSLRRQSRWPQMWVWMPERTSVIPTKVGISALAEACSSLTLPC